jgi:hypothetical protein
MAVRLYVSLILLIRLADYSETLIYTHRYIYIYCICVCVCVCMCSAIRNYPSVMQFNVLAVIIQWNL